MVNSNHVPVGWPTVIPRIAVDDPKALVAFIQDVFGLWATSIHALDRGAKSLEAPQDMPYGDRRAMVRDPWDNTWQIATHRGRFTP
jgi:PhnB protein